MANWSLRRDIQVKSVDDIEIKYYMECSECRYKEFNIDQAAASSGNWSSLVSANPICPFCDSEMMF